MKVVLPQKIQAIEKDNNFQSGPADLLLLVLLLLLFRCCCCSFCFAVAAVFVSLSFFCYFLVVFAVSLFHCCFFGVISLLLFRCYCFISAVSRMFDCYCCVAILVHNAVRRCCGSAHDDDGDAKVSRLFSHPEVHTRGSMSSHRVTLAKPFLISFTTWTTLTNQLKLSPSEVVGRPANDVRLATSSPYRAKKMVVPNIRDCQLELGN